MKLFRLKPNFCYKFQSGFTNQELIDMVYDLYSSERNYIGAGVLFYIKA
jgi:hypothetical protein